MSGTQHRSWPLSSAQRGIWFARRPDRGSPSHNTAEYLDISGPIDASLMEAAAWRTVAETGTLNVRFAQDGEGPRQMFQPAGDWFSVLDLSEEPDPQATAEAWMRADLGLPVMLDSGRTFALALLRIGADRWFLYARGHPLVADGSMYALTARRLAEVYTALLHGDPVREDGSGSLDLLLAEDAAYRASERFARDRDHWRDRLTGRPEAATLSSGSSGAPRPALRRTVRLSAGRVAALRASAGRSRVGLPVPLMAAMAVCLSRTADGDEVALGVPVTGRTGRGRGIRGPMSNELPLWLEVRPGMSVEDLMRQVSFEARLLLKHQRHRYEDPGRDPAAGGGRRLMGPAVNVMSSSHDLAFGAARAIPHNLAIGPVRDLSVSLDDRSGDGTARLHFDANPALYDAEETAAHQQRFLHVLDGLAQADPGRPVGGLGMPLPDERAQAAPPRGDIRTEAPARRTLSELFAAEPARRPDTVPLSFAQRRPWLLNRMKGRGATHNRPFALRLSGDLDPGALCAALNDVIVRHEILRTVFPDADGVPRQRVRAPTATAMPLPVRPVHPAGLNRALAEAAAHRFDLTSGPPFHAELLAVGAEENVLVFVLHHIAGDDWSSRLLARDLRTAYTARRAGPAPDWDPLPVQYADYTLWQHDLLGGADDPDSPLSRQAAYWTRALADLPAELALPTDRPRPAVPSDRGARVPFSLDAAAHARLRATARDGDASLFMVVQAVLAALLSRLGAGADIPVGTSTAGRADDALHDTVGLFANTLVLRTDTSGDPGFGELLARVRETNLAAHAHQDVPFDHLVGILDPDGSRSGHPLFQTMLTLDSAAEPRIDLPGLRVSPLQVVTTALRFDLSFTMAEEVDAAGGAAGIRGSLDYACDLFDESTAEWLAARFVRSLEAVAADPELPTADLPIAEDAENAEDARAPAGWSDTAVPAPPVTLERLFEARTARTPDAVAVVCEGVELSYAELNARANRLAHPLIERGAGPERVVAVALPRSEDLVVALLAVLKTGAACLPVDAEQPAERVRSMLDDARPVCGLTLGATAAGLPEAGLPWIAVDAPESTGAGGKRLERNPRDADRIAPLSPSHPAYVISTPGAEGRPKAVAVSHEGIVDRLLRMQQEHGLEPGEGVLQKTSAWSDVSVWEFFWPLVTGARLVMARPGGHRDPARPASVIREHAVTTVHLPPSALRAFLAVPGAAAASEGLRLLVANSASPRPKTIRSAGARTSA
ncbi:condensation domain-containing protein [Streptomyces sp. NPDC020141]|uniref:condensation domain-containing protein n=1 Tax=Streptomyces sp. NPDC020141 TaxID=3365065 RepID=UPI0037B63AE6